VLFLLVPVGYSFVCVVSASSCRIFLLCSCLMPVKHSVHRMKGTCLWECETSRSHIPGGIWTRRIGKQTLSSDRIRNVLSIEAECGNLPHISSLMWRLKPVWQLTDFLLETGVSVTGLRCILAADRAKRWIF
jgi:hypothetical protein